MSELSEADKVMINALACQVVIDRLTRAKVVGHTSKGRVMVELPHSEQTEAEKMYFGMRDKMTANRPQREDK